MVQALLIVGGGCAVFLGMMLLLVGACIWWVVKPGRQVPTVAIAGPSSAGMVQLAPLARDPGVRGAFERLSDEIGVVQAERALHYRPERQGGWGNEPSGPPTFLATMWIPSDATVVFERAAAGSSEGSPEDSKVPYDAVFAANFRWFVRPAGVFFRTLAAGDEELDSERYRGHTLLFPDDSDDGCFCFAGSTFLAGSSIDVVKLAIDRLEGYDPERPVSVPYGMPEDYEGWDLAGVLHGGAEDLRFLLRGGDPAHPSGRPTRWPERAIQGELDHVTLAVDWETPDLVRGVVTLQVADDLDVDDWMEELETGLVQLAEELEPEGLTLTSELDYYDGRIEIGLTLEGMEHVLERMARNF